MKAIKQAAVEHKLQVDILIDSSRGLRCSSLTHRYAGRLQPKSSPINKSSLQSDATDQYTSSADLLTSLTEVPGISVYLYHNPRLRGWLRYMLPNRLNEVLGVQHIKAYVFDDTVILSGLVDQIVIFAVFFSFLIKIGRYLQYDRAR